MAFERRHGLRSRGSSEADSECPQLLLHVSRRTSKS